MGSRAKARPQHAPVLRGVQHHRDLLSVCGETLRRAREEHRLDGRPDARVTEEELWLLLSAPSQRKGLMLES